MEGSESMQLPLTTDLDLGGQEKLGSNGFGSGTLVYRVPTQKKKTEIKNVKKHLR